MCAALLVLVPSSTAPRAAQAESLDALLARTAAYVADFIHQFTNVVAVEQYEQRGTPLVVSATGRPTPRRLRSEVLLVRDPLSEQDWLMFRDVTEVNGKPVRQPEDRLLTLFADPTAEAAERAARIAAESARYHLPGASFAATNPLLVLALMQAHYQPRLQFTPGGVERSMGQDVRVVRFEERRAVTREQGDTRRVGDTAAPLLGEAGFVRGAVWVSAETGRILKTEARLEGAGTASTSITTFASDERLGLFVPKEMRTTWLSGGRPVNGTARYSEFRRFSVHTETGPSRPQLSPADNQGG